MREGDRIAGGSSLLDTLAEWAAAEAAQDRARSRERRRWLEQAASEESTFAGVLVDLAERRGGVVLTLVNGARVAGRVAAVGADFVALRTPRSAPVLVAIEAVSAARVDIDQPPLGDQAVSLTRTLRDVLFEAADERPRILVDMTDSDDVLAAELVQVGRDVITVRLDGTDRQHLVIRMSAIRQVAFAL